MARRARSKDDRCGHVRQTWLTLLVTILGATGCLVHQERLWTTEAGPFRITRYGQPDCQSISDPNPIRIKPAWRSTRRVLAYALSPDSQMYAFARSEWGLGRSLVAVGVADRHGVLVERLVDHGGVIGVRWMGTDAVAVDRRRFEVPEPVFFRDWTEIVKLTGGEEASP